MKPIGTVTKYYRFVNKETEETLDAMMTEAKDFRDLVIRLGDRICSEAVSPELVLIASVLAWQAGEKRVKELIASNYPNLAIAKPWTLSSVSFWDPDGVAVRKRIHEAIDEVVESKPEDWILMELHIRRAGTEIYVPEGAALLDEAKNLLDRNSKFEGFAPYILDLEAMIRRHEGDDKTALVLCRKGLESARRFEDVYIEARLLLTKASVLGKDTRKALELTEDAYNLSRTAGIPDLVADTLTRMALIATSLGEYDLALESYLKAMKQYESMGISETHLPINVSELYCDMNDGRHALEWATHALQSEYAGGIGGLEDHICPRIAMARALTLSDRIEEAVEHVTTANEIALRSGLEHQLAQSYFVTGLHEMAAGESTSGMQTIERALEISERLGGQTFINRCLIALTEAEAADFSIDFENLDPRESGPWMARLEQEGRQKNLPGILMQHALIKADFQSKLDQKAAARDTLLDALEIHDSLGVKTLRKWIRERIKKLEPLRLSD